MVGCGWIGCDPGEGTISHAAAYDTCPDTELVAVCDTDQARLERCAGRWGVAGRYRRIEDLLGDARPEVVSVCTPDSTHADLLHTTLGAPGVAGVLAEKPLALEASASLELARLAEERSVVLSVNYIRRFSPAYADLRDSLARGELGEICSVSGRYTGGLFHNGTHWIDLARFLVGEVDTVWGWETGTASTSGEPALDAYLRFQNGAAGLLSGSGGDAFSVFEMDLLCRGGRVRLTESGEKIELSRPVPSPRWSGFNELKPEPARQAGLATATLGAVDDLVRCIRDGGVPRCSGLDGAAAVQVAAAIAAAARTGRAVTLKRKQ